MLPCSNTSLPPMLKPLSFHPGGHVTARSKAIIGREEDKLFFFSWNYFVEWLLPYPISFLSFQDWTIFAVFFITLDRVLSGNIKNTSRLRTCHVLLGCASESVWCLSLPVKSTHYNFLPKAFRDSNEYR